MFCIVNRVLIAFPAQAEANPIQSCLSEANIGMSRAVNEAVATGAVTTALDCKNFVSCTLLAATSDFQVWPMSVSRTALALTLNSPHLAFC